MAGEEKYGTKAIIALLANIKNKISDIEENAVNKEDFKELTDKVTALEEQLDTKEDIFSPGEGLEMTEDRILNITLDLEIFWVNSTVPDIPPVGKSNKILLVPNHSSTDEGNYYTEYIWVIDTEHPDGHYEELGTYKSDVDLTAYQTKIDNNLQTTNKTIVGAINEVNNIFDYIVFINTEDNKTVYEELNKNLNAKKIIVLYRNDESNKYRVFVEKITKSGNFITVYTSKVYGDTSGYNFIIGIGNCIYEKRSNTEYVKIGNPYDTENSSIRIGRDSGTFGDNYYIPSLAKIKETFQQIIDNSLQTTNKTIIGAINELNDKTPVYTVVPTLSADYTIPANATTREYIYEISIGATTYNVTAAEGIKWIDNNLPLVEANSKLIVSVVNNIAVWGTVYE